MSYTNWISWSTNHDQIIMRLEQDSKKWTLVLRVFPNNLENESYIEFRSSVYEFCGTQALEEIETVKIFLLNLNQGILDWNNYLWKHSQYSHFFLDFKLPVRCSGFKGEILSSNDLKHQILTLRFEIAHIQYELARLLHAFNAIGFSTLLDNYKKLSSFSIDFKKMFEFSNADYQAEITRLNVEKEHYSSILSLAMEKMTKINNITMQFFC